MGNRLNEAVTVCARHQKVTIPIRITKSPSTAQPLHQDCLQPVHLPEPFPCFLCCPQSKLHFLEELVTFLQELLSFNHNEPQFSFARVCLMPLDLKFRMVTANMVDLGQDERDTDYLTTVSIIS